MRPHRVTITPQVDADGICASQTPLAAGNLTIAGALASGGSVSLNHGHLIKIACAGADAGRTFTLTGTDYSGVSMTEAVSGENAGTATSVKYFKTITQVAVDDATAGAITVGVNGESVSNWITLDRNQAPFSVGFGVVVTGTIDYTVQHTFDDIQIDNPSGATAYAHASIAAKTDNQNSNYAYPCVATRLFVNSVTSGATLTFNAIQAGTSG